MIHHEYPTDQEEFDKYASDLPVVNEETYKEDGYKLYGEKGLASKAKFKLTDKGEISILLLQPESVHCYTCEIDFKTEKNPEKCPSCGKTIYDILDVNRKFVNKWNEFQTDSEIVHKRMLINVQVNMSVEAGIIKPEEAESEIERLEGIHCSREVQQDNVDLVKEYYGNM